MQPVPGVAKGQGLGSPGPQEAPPLAVDVRLSRPSTSLGGRVPGTWLTRLVCSPAGAGGVKMPRAELPEVRA